MARWLSITPLIVLASLMGTLRAEPLDAYRGKSRVLVVFYSDCTMRDTFERTWASAVRGAKERDLIILRADGPLRSALGLSDSANAALLFGKDGTEKMRWERPPAPDEVFRIIDAMPMRQQEMRTDP